MMYKWPRYRKKKLALLIFFLFIKYAPNQTWKSTIRGIFFLPPPHSMVRRVGGHRPRNPNNTNKNTILIDSFTYIYLVNELHRGAGLIKEIFQVFDACMSSQRFNRVVVAGMIIMIMSLTPYTPSTKESYLITACDLCTS